MCARVCNGVFHLKIFHPPDVVNVILTSRRGWLPVPAAWPHSLALVWVIVADEILANLFGELSVDGGSKPCPSAVAAAALDLLFLLSLSFFCLRMQFLQLSYATWLVEPFGRATKSKKS